ncbi:hypothetical protein SAMN02746073_2878 [Legionella jamestowniensis DSM 19215]|nr:hypothetical protein SAMN02746073_2878 [Legionella jamestowniensis DSM 19215]
MQIRNSEINDFLPIKNHLFSNYLKVYEFYFISQIGTPFLHQ